MGGSLWIFTLHPNSSVKHQQLVSNGEGGLPSDLLSSGDMFGYSVCSVGDLDGDMIPDIVVGAPYAIGAGSVSYSNGEDDDPMLDDPAMDDPSMDDPVMDDPVMDDPALSDDEPPKGTNETTGTDDAPAGPPGGIGGGDDGGGDDNPNVRRVLRGNSRRVQGNSSSTASTLGSVFILFMGSDSTVKAWQTISSSQGGLGMSSSSSSSSSSGSSGSAKGDMMGASVYLLRPAMGAGEDDHDDDVDDVDDVFGPVRRLQLSEEFPDTMYPHLVYVAVGAPGRSDSSGESTGAVFVFGLN